METALAALVWILVAWLAFWLVVFVVIALFAGYAVWDGSRPLPEERADHTLLKRAASIFGGVYLGLGIVTLFILGNTPLIATEPWWSLAFLWPFYWLR